MRKSVKKIPGLLEIRGRTSTWEAEKGEHMSNVKQYKMDVTVRMVVTVDEDQTDIQSVLSDMHYDFEASWDSAEIVETEITDWEQVGEVKTDTIKC